MPVATRLILGRGRRNRFGRGKVLVESVRTEQVVSQSWWSVKVDVRTNSY